MNLSKVGCCGLLIVSDLLLGCSRNESVHGSGGLDDDLQWVRQRMAMIKTLRARGIDDEAVLQAMSEVRRHAFIPEACRATCDPYADHPCPIGYGQTISQPYVVAYMTSCLNVSPGERVLEIGTGSGYQAAVLAAMGARVYSIEIVRELAEHARRILPAEGYANVALLEGDGYLGWPEHAPFDLVIVTCAPENIPDALVAQLKVGGRMVVPIGIGDQRLVMLTRTEAGIERVNDLPVKFVPMVHREE
ncbi:MAG: protein-L-isoaspartate(D-aspartate) O-methyltransferase [Verrucomicrobia bacterium]|nr:protein-L-isoaspartate(D-aspartate) O-methyltransferase [Verrucomicrobiota bacterium]